MIKLSVNRPKNGCRINLDIKTGGKLSPIYLAKMELICHWSVRSSRRRGKGSGRGNRYFSPLRVSLYYASNIKNLFN